MTDLEILKEMFTRCGHKFEVDEPKVCPFWEGKNPSEITAIEMTVTGCFYDELYVFFDATGSLLEMQSHVASATPCSDKLRTALGLEPVKW